MPASNWGKLAAHISSASRRFSQEVAGSAGSKYLVSRDPAGRWSCTCSDFKIRKNAECKHIRHVAELREWEKAFLTGGK